jgi:hypothetical protein
MALIHRANHPSKTGFNHALQRSEAMREPLFQRAAARKYHKRFGLRYFGLIR